MKRKPILATIVFFCAVWLTLCGCTAEIKPEESFSAPEFPYTFARSLETDNGEVTFYESGDSVRKFCHDQAGRILIREESKITYALNENGKCVSSGISYPAQEKVANSVATYAEDIDWEKNPDWCIEEEVEDGVSNEPLLGTDFQGTIVNIVIFIAFADDTDTIDESKVEGMFQGAGDSLSHYFNEVSNGKLQIKNLMPRENTHYYVYRAPNARSYYYVGSNKTQERGKKEAELLTGAVAAAKNKLNTLGLNLDVNRDGYLDAVSFLIGGASSGDWGNLLWPHSWNLTTINNSYNSHAAAEIGGVKVGDFSFNFLDGLTTGVMCHEFFHVLGAPDLYHYNYDFVPVGDWDLMQFNHATPQYPLAYMRETYLNGALGDTIGTVRHNGVYTLKPVTSAGEGDVAAYKIPTDRAGEYFMVEYRDPSRAVTYDRSLPSAGLIVYRIKEGVKDGNRNAKYQNRYYPDEVYVFRPRVASTGLETKDTVRYANSKEDLNYAAMSPANPYFSSVGTFLQAGAASALYDYRTLFYTNGANSGIVIETLSMSRDGIAFSVSFSGGDTIDDTYFEDKIFLSDGQFVNTETFSGVLAEVAFEEIDTSYLGGLEIKLYDDREGVSATAYLSAGEFLARYAEGERTFPVRFIVNDKGNALTGVFRGGVMRGFSKPVRLTATAVDADGDSSEVAESVIGKSNWSWEEILATRVEPTASVSAGNNLTVGVRTDGTVTVSGNRGNQGQWAVSGMTNAVEASAGYSHTLVRTKDLKVSAAGTDTNGETAVAHWQNIRMIAAGYCVSYGVTLDGTVLFAGQDAYGLSAVTEWQGVRKISAGRYHVLGLSADGTVLAAGNNASGQCALPKGKVTDIAAGRAFSAYLYADGTVEVVGNLIGKEEIGAWADVYQLAAGENHLVGLTTDGRVLSVGDNGYGQCNTENFVDVISVSASEYHTAVLRRDGVVEIAGAGPKFPLEITKNLIYDTNAYIAVERIILNADTNLVYVGEETVLSVGFYPAMATYTRAIYSSDRPDVASVDPLTGKVTAKAEGRVTLRATDKGTGLQSSVTLDVYVLKDAVDVAFSEERILISAGKSLVEAFEFQPADATRFGDLRVEVLDGGDNLTASLIRPTDSVCQMVRLVAGENTGIFRLRLSYVSPTGEIKIHAATVQIVSGITSIRLTETGRTEYRYGEPLEGGGALEVTYDDGQTTTAFVNAAMLSYETVYMVGPNRVRVTYMDKTTFYQITVHDFAERVGISPTVSPKLSFLYGETPDFSQGEICIYYAGGTAPRPVPLSDATVLNLNTQKAGRQTLTVAYEVSDPITGTSYLIYGNYAVTVEDTVTAIASALTQKSYRYGQAFTKTDLFTVEMASGEINTLEISKCVVSGFDSTILGIQNLTISYTDPVTQKVFSTQDTVSVTLSGKLQIVGGDGGFEMMGRQIYWYEIGAETLGISILILGDDGTGIEVPKGNGNENLWYELTGFSPEKEGEGQAILHVYGKKLTDNGVEEVVLYGPISLATYGRSAIVRAYLEGDETVRYGETPKIFLVIEEESGAVLRTDSAEFIYDPELVDVPQIVMTRFMNEYVTGFLTVLDYGVALQIGGASEVYYGEEPQFRVELITASGKARVLEQDSYQKNYTVTNLKGELTVVYGELSVKKVYEVIDLLTEMSAVGEWKRYYLYGEALRTDYLVRLEFKSGAVKEVSFLSEEFRYHTDYQPTAGRYTVTLRCVAYEKELSYSVLVEDYVSELLLNPPKEIEYGNPFDCQITAVYAGGRRVNVPLSQVNCNFDSDAVGRQEITVSYVYSLAAGNKVAKAVCVVFVTDAVVSVSLLQEPVQKNYRYGEAFLFLGGKIRVTYRSGKTADYDNQSLSLFEISYQPTRTGAQTVTMSVGGKSVTVAVSVRVETESTLELTFPDGVICDKKSGLVVTETPMTAEEVLKCIAPVDYLSARISYENEGPVPTGTRIEVVNENGVAVYAFRYILKGDANGDGVFDIGDMQGLVNGYALGALDSDLASVDGNGEVTLTDLVKWAKKAKEKSSVPVNALGKNFIKAIRKGEEVYEERAI